MNSYFVVLTRKAQKSLDKLSNHAAQPLHNAISGLSSNPRPKGCKKLVGREAYRIRIGSYRIIYRILDEVLIVEVIDLGHRKDIYG
ncbi:MAG: type II toxin-antitoxin system RelE/ParE family toxin [Saprospiraceae bacterium]